MLKQNKGITLVALVITIIVLLILAGVSISMVVGQNGILNRATNAAEETAEADARSALEVALSGAQGYFIDDWNKDQTTRFQAWLADNDDKLEADGYTFDLSAGTMTKTGGNTYEFTLTYKDYGATINTFSVKKST